jgi:chemotaxis methyl-accepting protein methylase
MDLSFTPTLDRAQAERRLERLLVPGPILNQSLANRIERLACAFRSYADCYPLPLWAPGLMVDNEMRALTEALFPLSRVRALFEAVLAKGCRFSPLFPASYLHSSACWLDLLPRLRPQPAKADPAALLEELALDGEKRRRFLFALFLPQHFGGGFDRYPLQSRWLESRLKDDFGRLKGRMRALDSACGSGEGTYGLAELLRAAGFRGEGCVVHGSTLEPIELFAAAHLFFPHDPDREREYRARVAPLLKASGSGKAAQGTAEAAAMEFYLDEVGSEASRESYQLILCNGLLGGPLLHEPGALSRAVGALAARLAPGGVLLAADRFHAGWRLRVPAAALSALMREHGLAPLQVPEGVGAIREAG